MSCFPETRRQSSRCATPLTQILGFAQEIQSSDDDNLINETRRKPTTGTRCPTLFDKWHGIFYMPRAQTCTPGHTNAFIYPVMESRCSGMRQIRTADLSVHSRTCHPPDHAGPGGIFSLLGGSSVKHRTHATHAAGVNGPVGFSFF